MTSRVVVRPGVWPAKFRNIATSGFSAARTRSTLRETSFQLAEVQTRVYDTAAVATARQTGRGAYRGNPIPTDLHATLVLVQQSGAWRLAGIHMSFIAGTPGAPPIPGRP